MAEPDINTGRAQVAAEDILDDGLGYLLAGLREPPVTLGREPEGIVEVGDPAAGQRFAERDSLRPGDRKRRGRPQGLGDTPSAQVLHRAHAGGLRSRAPVRDLRARLDHDAVNPMQVQLGSRGQPGRAAADDHDGTDAHVCILGAVGHSDQG